MHSISKNKINSSIEQAIYCVEDLDEIKNVLYASQQSLILKKEALYPKMYSWDLFLLRLPLFISKIGAYDQAKLLNYNQLNVDIQNMSNEICKTEATEAHAIKCLYDQVITSELVSKDINCLPNVLEELTAVRILALKTLACLENAETYERNDSLTNNEGLFGLFMHGSSRNKNFQAVQHLTTLNQQVQEFNLFLSKQINSSEQGNYMLDQTSDFSFESINLMNAEINEDNPIFMMTGDLGAWWGSQNTLSSIQKAKEKVSYLLESIDFNQAKLKTKLKDEFLQAIEKKSLSLANKLKFEDFNFLAV